jgi:hypothetical protein
MVPVHEQIMVAVQARFASIVGDGGVTYFHSVAYALRWPTFSGDVLDHTRLRTTPGKDVICVIVPDSTPRKDGMSKHREGTIRFDVVMAKRFIPAGGENPFTRVAPLRETIQAELAADAESALCGDPRLTWLSGLGLASTPMPRVVTDDRSFEATGWEGWAGCFLGCEIDYSYLVTRS